MSRPNWYASVELSLETVVDYAAAGLILVFVAKETAESFRRTHCSKVWYFTLKDFGGALLNHEGPEPRSPVTVPWVPKLKSISYC
jgi:hypothetical protein